MNEDVTRPTRSADGGPRALSGSASAASRDDYAVSTRSPSESGPRAIPSAPSLPRSERSEGTRDDARPVAAIMGELWSNTETLVRQEVELGLAEMDRRTERLQNDVKQAAVGSAVAFSGVLTLVAAVVLLLANFVAPWVAALIVGLAASGGGYAMLKLGTEDLDDAAAAAVRRDPGARGTSPRTNEPRHLEGGHS